MASPKDWHYKFQIQFPFHVPCVESSSTRATWDIAMKEGVELAKKFAEKGIRVSVNVIDIRDPNYGYANPVQFDNKD